MSDLGVWIGGEIRAARKRKGLSGVELGKRIGCSQVTISRIENGEQSVTIERLFEIYWAITDTHAEYKRKIGE